jgi:hypothetical protein
MSGKEAFVQGPGDSSGKRIANLTVTLPAGTPVTNADGSQSVLTAPAEVFIQKVTLVDAQGNTIRDFGAGTLVEILLELKRIRWGMSLLADQSLLDVKSEDD